MAVTIVPSAGGTVSGDGTYNSGDLVNMAATPNSGYAFVNWTENDIEITTDASFSFNIDTDRDLVANFTKLLTIYLLDGWNIMSFNVLPDNPDMFTILTPLIDEGSLQKVQDEAGKAIVYILGVWIKEIGDMTPTEGYKIRVNKNTQLTVSGTSVQLPYNIPLALGWNIMGFPATEMQNSQDVVADLIAAEELVKVQDQTGSAIVFLDPNWFYGIVNFAPGEGYKINVNTGTSITISGIANKSAFIPPKTVVPAHFSPSWTGNGYNHMNIYIFNTEGLENGDEIAVFDGENCVGTGIMNIGKDYISIIASMDDPLTRTKDGFVNGNDIQIRAWNKNQNKEYSIENVLFNSKFSDKFYESGTSVIESIPENNAISSLSSWNLGDVYPNPFHDHASINYSLSEKTNVRIEIYNMTGKIIKVLTDKTEPQGNHTIRWNGTDQKGNRVASGVYFYRMVTRDFVNIKTIMFIER